MTNYGHISHNITINLGDGGTQTIAHIDTWGAGPFVICINGKRYWFTDSDMFGPLLESASGRVLDRQPGEKSPFWTAYTMWRKGGRRCRSLARVGVCKWRKPLRGQYWKDEHGLLHVVRDPDLDFLGYDEIPRPQPMNDAGSRKGGALPAMVADTIAATAGPATASADGTTRRAKNAAGMVTSTQTNTPTKTMNTNAAAMQSWTGDDLT